MSCPPCILLHRLATMNDALLDTFNIDLLLLLLLPTGLMAVANALLGKLKIDFLLLFLLPK
jgi:hypothetical protein